MRLAIVEDNPELARLLAQGLKAEGYETDLLTTAAAARAAVSTTRYAALILGSRSICRLRCRISIRRRTGAMPTPCWTRTDASCSRL